MSWFGTLLSWFGISGGERVNLLSFSPDEIEVISPLLLSDQETIISDQKMGPGITRRPGLDRRVKSRGLSYFNTPGGAREWVAPQYDHVEIEILYDVESYFARATRAKLALFLKEGYEFVGSNEERVKYIRTRIQQIERISSIPFSLLLLQVERDLLVHSNAYWLKVRKIESSGGRVRTVGKKTLKPVAGYFRLPPEAMVPEIDSSGNIVRWKVYIEGTERVFSVDDIVHYYKNKKAGYPLGVPDIVPAIDDIRALRSLEHNIDVLVHKHLFPIILWKVGTETRPAAVYSDGDTEIEVVKNRIANMPMEGSLVVPERYDVKAIGVENKALRVESYLTHFKERLLAGLDVSSIDVGVGNTASRSTANTLSRNLVDVVKLDQITIQELSVSVIEELLLESTFDPSTVLDSENMVFLRFHEIEKEAKQSEANHYVDLYHKDVLTFPETRIAMGRDILTPEEEKELHWHKLGKEQALTGPMNESSEAVENKNKPQNQHGTRGSAKLNRDNYISSTHPGINPLLSWHLSIGAELQSRWTEGTFLIHLAEADIRSTYESAVEDFLPILRRVIMDNYPDSEKIAGLYKLSENRVRKHVMRLRKEVVRRLKSGDDSPNLVFESLRYRTSLIFNTEINQARNLARYRWFVNHQKDIRIVCSDDPCSVCKSKLTTIRWDDKLGEAKIPCFHPNCTCRVEMVEEMS